MSRIAFMTAGLLLEAPNHPLMQDFIDAGAATFAGAEASVGFIARSQWPYGDSEPAWGAALVPRVFEREINAVGRNMPTLSLWRDIESVYAFAYNGIHAQMLRRRKEWFMPHDFPAYVLWWVDDNHHPTWEEADARYDLLCRNGSTVQAFDFKQPFDADGQAVQINRATVRENIQKGTTLTEQAIIQTTVNQYLAAWNETDAAARQTILQAVWGKGATYTDPLSHATTLEALNAVISQFVANNTGATFSLKGEISQHHQSCRFFWTLRFANGVEVEGMDYGEIDAEGKLTKIVGFF